MARAFDPRVQLAGLSIPEHWHDLDAFADWYMAAGAPLMVPWDAEVITSDDATAICLFRKAPYQVELYLVHPGEFITEHAHPGLETMVVHLGGGRSGQLTEHGVSDKWGVFGGRTLADQTHGSGLLGFCKTGFAMLSMQRWQVGASITSAAVHWRGSTAGPKQDALIRRHHPNAIAIPGFADVARSKSEPVL